MDLIIYMHIYNDYYETKNGKKYENITSNRL